MDRHIVFARHMSGPDRGAYLESDDDIAAALRDKASAWLHLMADHPETTTWIDEHLGYLDPAIRSALTEQQVRPRALRIGDGLLLILRGINLNEGADPEDMISLRMYADAERIVSLSRRRLESVDVLCDRISHENGPDNTGTFLAHLVELLTDRIEAQVADLDDRSETLEAAVIEDPRTDFGSETTDQRLELADLRRFLPPQRDAVRDMLRTDLGLFSDGDRASLNEQLDQLTRVVETLDAVRDQLTTIRTEIDSARDERLNRNLYVLSMISAVFLPLGFMTGLMGINLAGMPGANWPLAFWVFCAMMAGLGVAVLLILKWFRLL